MSRWNNIGLSFFTTRKKSTTGGKMSDDHFVVRDSRREWRAFEIVDGFSTRFCL